MKKIVLLNIILIVAALSSDRGLSVTLKGSFTTDTRFLYNIDRTNSLSEERTISSNLGYGADVRWNILWDRFFLGASFEKISGSENVSVLHNDGGYFRVPYKEGFELLALELSGYYVVPISSENIRFYLGGGLGAYDGDRKFSIAGVTAATVSSVSFIGIHVLTGIDYMIAPQLALRFEIKFRDPHFDVTSKFDQAATEYQGRTITLPAGEYVTKINLYGVNYVGGLVLTL